MKQIQPFQKHWLQLTSIVVCRLKCFFLKENARISPKISLEFIPKVPVNNIPALVQIMRNEKWRTFWRILSNVFFQWRCMDRRHNCTEVSSIGQHWCRWSGNSLSHPLLGELVKQETFWYQLRSVIFRPHKVSEAQYRCLSFSNRLKVW